MTAPIDIQFKYASLCNSCAHLGEGRFCDAFPDGDGIPDDIFVNGADHRQPVEGDGGVQWSLKPGTEDEHEVWLMYGLGSIVQEAKSLVGDLEEKVVRHVRTPAGARKFGQPVGSVIVADGRLSNLSSVASEFDGWEKYHGQDGGTYYVGKNDGGKFSVTDQSDQELHEAATQEAALRWLDDKAAGSKPSRQIPADTPLNAIEPAPGHIKMDQEFDGYDGYMGLDGKEYFISTGPGKVHVTDRADNVLYEGDRQGAVDYIDRVAQAPVYGNVRERGNRSEPGYPSASSRARKEPVPVDLPKEKPGVFSVTKPFRGGRGEVGYQGQRYAVFASSGVLGGVRVVAPDGRSVTKPGGGTTLPVSERGVDRGRAILAALRELAPPTATDKDGNTIKPGDKVRFAGARPGTGGSGEVWDVAKVWDDGKVQIVNRYSNSGRSGRTMNAVDPKRLRVSKRSESEPVAPAVDTRYDMTPDEETALNLRADALSKFEKIGPNYDRAVAENLALYRRMRDQSGRASEARYWLAEAERDAKRREGGKPTEHRPGKRAVDELLSNYENNSGDTGKLGYTITGTTVNVYDPERATMEIDNLLNIIDSNLADPSMLSAEDRYDLRERRAGLQKLREQLNGPGGASNAPGPPPTPQAPSQARAGSPLTEEQYSYFAPVYGKLSQRRLDKVRSTPEGRRVVEAVEAFTSKRGGVTRLRNDVATYVNGGELPEERRLRAEAFVSAINNYPGPVPELLYRGAAMKSMPWAEFDQRYGVGAEIDLNVSSFSSKPPQSQAFINANARSHDIAVMLVVRKGSAKALPVENFSKFKYEKEWVAGGRFRVVERRTDDPTGVQFIYVEQVGTL